MNSYGVVNWILTVQRRGPGTGGTQNRHGREEPSGPVTLQVVKPPRQYKVQHNRVRFVVLRQIAWADALKEGVLPFRFLRFITIAKLWQHFPDCKIIRQTIAEFKFAGVFLSLRYENPPESYKFPEGLKDFTYCCYLLTEVVV